MNLSAPFINRPVATILITVAIALAGLLGYELLPVAPLPQIDFPTISISASLPGASPEIMASSVATPLERQLAHIAGITEMTSASNLGTTSITLQFDLSRNIDGAARDVEAAINAARTYLPSNLPANPTYRKVNPADAPILILALTSKTLSKGELYDKASTYIQQRLSQIPGVGQVFVGGSSLPAVRVEVNPHLLDSYGVRLSQVASLLKSQNSNSPKGFIASDKKSYTITTNDQLFKADSYKPLVINYNKGSALRLLDIADVQDSVQDVRASGYFNNDPAVMLIIFRTPGANIIKAVDSVNAALPYLRSSLPAAAVLSVVLDRTATIRASVKDVEITLLISILLVILVVFVFLRSVRATLIPSVTVPISLIGTFAIMKLLNFSLDNLSLMALTVSTGFVVDDAVVVIENITRHIENGEEPLSAAFKGAQEIGFTVLAMSLSLIAVFVPILLMGGIVGRLLREFAITLSIAIMMSLLLALTTTPMMCSRLLNKPKPKEKLNSALQFGEKVFAILLDFYKRTLNSVLKHPALTLGVLLLTIAANIYFVLIIPKGFFPQQDNGTIQGAIQGSQDASFQDMDKITRRYVGIIKSDPAVENVVAFTGGRGATNGGFVYIALKPLEKRVISASKTIDRLRPKLGAVAGSMIFLQAGQDVQIGGRQTNAQYQYNIQSEDLSDLVSWGPQILRQMKHVPGLVDVNSDQQNNGLQTFLKYDRPTLARLGLNTTQVDSALYQNFGQALVSTIYTNLNQYYVVLEAAPAFAQGPQALSETYINTGDGKSIPLRVIATAQNQNAPLSVNHEGQFPSVTASFNLAAGVSLSEAAARIEALQTKMGKPASIQGFFSGTLQAFQDSLSNEKILILTALLAVYIVLGILYESYIHPITILSTLPSAGVGAFLTLMLFHMDLDIVGFIGIILLIGIVNKNAILMIDFALSSERNEGKSAKDSIFEACLLRFRPILMTTFAALFGAVPLAIGTGIGSELRRPLGISIIGGLIFSQILTLYTTPVIYIYMDRLRSRPKVQGVQK
jgi:multidrug efflux pump